MDFGGKGATWACGDRYMWTISVSGQHNDWICVPSVSALVRKGGESLARKVLKAKVLAGILGTMETKLISCVATRVWTNR